MRFGPVPVAQALGAILAAASAHVQSPQSRAFDRVFSLARFRGVAAACEAAWKAMGVQ